MRQWLYQPMGKQSSLHRKAQPSPLLGGPGNTSHLQTGDEAKAERGLRVSYFPPFGIPFCSHPKPIQGSHQRSMRKSAFQMTTAQILMRMSLTRMMGLWMASCKGLIFSFSVPVCSAFIRISLPLIFHVPLYEYQFQLMCIQNLHFSHNCYFDNCLSWNLPLGIQDRKFHRCNFWLSVTNSAAHRHTFHSGANQVQMNKKLQISYSHFSKSPAPIVHFGLKMLLSYFI